VSIDEFSVLEPMTGLRPAADTVTGPPEDWRAAVTGYRPPAGPDGYWPPPRLGDRDEPELGGTDPMPEGLTLHTPRQPGSPRLSPAVVRPPARANLGGRADAVLARHPAPREPCGA
jgi:hypothetical protein